MKFDQLLSKKVNRYLPHIFLIAISIGTANYFIHGLFNWFQWIILSVSTCFLIGYSLLSIAAHKSSLQQYFQDQWKLYVSLILGFFLIGFFASEVENIIKNLVFSHEAYRAFAAGSTYLTNGIISMALGLSFFLNNQLFPLEAKEEVRLHPLSSEQEARMEEGYPIAKIPVRQGESILLISVEDIVYFEAFDNYSFVFDLKGNKMLCDYSLLFLEKRLGKEFMRIHRKFIVNTVHIKQIKPHLNSRYVILFDRPELKAITSSKSYSSTIRSLIKIE